MTAADTATSPHETAGKASLWIKRGLEFLWLLTVVAVPLAFVGRESFLSELELAYVDVPKTVLLRTLVGLMAILWVVEWALQRQVQIERPITGKIPHLQPADWLRNLAGWLKIDPTRWVTLAVVLYLASTLFSTALSESFRVSMWGLVPGQDSYPAYTITCYVVLFGVVATHLKSKAQVQRLLWAIAFTGSLVGVYAWAQFYGHDVFNLREAPGGSRSGSTLGNSILAGSVFLMTITVSLAAATSALSELGRTGKDWGKLGLWTLVLTVQMTGLIFTSSRGPWGGTVVALVALIFFVGVFAGWRYLARMGLVLALAVALTAAIVAMPPPLPTGEPTRAPTARTEDGYYEIAPPVEAAASGSTAGGFAFGTAASTRLISVGTEVGRGGLSGRMRIWENAGRLILRRPWFESEAPSISILRPLIGYGPDMFKYTYLLERLPKGPDRVSNSERFAHNILIHRGVELGILGLLATLGLFATPFFSGGYQLILQHRRNSTFRNLVLAGLMAALAGRFVEQMVGVAAVSDLTIFWVLLALFVALPAANSSSQAVPSLVPEHRQGQRSSRFTPTARMRIPDAHAVLAVVAVCLIAGIGVLTWTKSINYLEAGFKAREGLDGIREAEFQNALVSLDRAIDLAPDVYVYHTLRAAVYAGYRRQDHGPKERECASLAEATLYERCLLRKIHLNHQEAAKQRPFDLRPRLNLAESALTLALMDRDLDMASEATRLYREVAQLDPQAWWHWELLAAAHIKVGQYEAALEPLEKALVILDGIPRSANSRLLQGMAYLELDEPATALRSFDQAVRLNPKLADAYTNRGASYNALGQYQRAILDLDEVINRNLDQLEKEIRDYDHLIQMDPRRAWVWYERALAYTYLGKDEEARADVERGKEFGLDPGPLLAKMEGVLNPGMAIAYNNRGNSYGNLDQIQRAIQDFDEAIRLDRQFALAYSNRALAYTYIGRDDDARMDVERGTELGLDPGPILAQIEKVKNNR